MVGTGVLSLAFVEQCSVCSIYYSRYSTPYLSGEGKRGDCADDCCGRRTRDVIISHYRMTGIYTFG